MIKNGLSILLVTLPVILSLVFLGWRFKQVQKTLTVSNHLGPAKEPSTLRFGFLGTSNLIQYSDLSLAGFGWVHPYPGPFIWGKMQKGSGENISFSETDKLVIAASNNNLSILATIWPYSASDLKLKPNLYTCQVEKDELELELGNFRCNPFDPIAYEKWVSELVERYDGDGNGDMPNLPLKIKHWEILSKVDLEQFYKYKPTSYGSLLGLTYEAIKKSDPEAKVLIAASSSSEQKSLDFYKDIFASNPEFKNYFDIANTTANQDEPSYNSLNLEPYKAMLAESGIEKPIWVTQVEAPDTQDLSVYIEVLQSNTKSALELGAEKILYANTKFDIETFKKIPQNLY